MQAQTFSAAQGSTRFSIQLLRLPLSLVPPLAPAAFDLSAELLLKSELHLEKANFLRPKMSFHRDSVVLFKYSNSETFKRLSTSHFLYLNVITQTLS